MMKCKNCNGSVSVYDGFYVCDSCGSKFELYDFFENIEVYIAYIESDENGRRTKDSIIAQDIYQKFQAKKISTFYSRISADNLCGDDFEKACIAAINRAKIVVILGISGDNFNSLNEKYGDYFANKIVIPVFSDIDASQIPKSISKIQALDYSKIGSSVTLENSVLNALGREKETSDSDIFNHKKTKKWLVLFICILCVIFAVAAYFLFGLNSDVDSNEGEGNLTAESDAVPVVTDARPEKYRQALNHIEEEKYADAIKLLSELPGYKDSDKQLQLIYDKYAGYYGSVDDGITAHFKTTENLGIVLDLTYFVSGGFIRIAEMSKFTLDTAVFEFIDTENNHGTITLTLKNTTVDFSLKTTDINSELYLAEKDISFNLSERSDKPKTNIDAEKLMGWVKTPTTFEDLRRLGYEVSLTFSSPRMDVYEEYEIKNTDVELSSVWDCNYIGSIRAPAELLIPDYIGKPGNQFYIGDVLVIPNASSYGNPAIPWGWENNDIITKDTPVLILTEASVNALEYGDFDEYYEANATYTSSIAETDGTILRVKVEGHNIYSSPSFSSIVVQPLPKGAYTIINEQTDGEGKLWGKLKSGLGWVCMTDIE